jgi:hypothetical protein
MTHVALSLISHTNVGKTTLARTLLRRDVGEVRDLSHVTLQSERYTLIETPNGDRLDLWDTPGFGDSVRLRRRLEQSSNPLGWLLSQVWDRFADRAFFSSQQAVRNARDDAHVVLYLVNAAEDAAASAYVDPEMRILEWIGKPVIAVLNQLGPPDAAREAADLASWRERLAAHPLVRGVLAFDAFARCWVHEHVLLDRVVELVPAPDREGCVRLVDAWQARNREAFEASMGALAAQLTATALDEETVPPASIGATLRGWLRGLVGEKAADDPAQQAMARLAERLDQRVVDSTGELIALHGLSGRASSQVLERLRSHFELDLAIDPGKASLLGAAITGALGGLAADLSAGGLTLGGGALLGGLLGAAGSRGLARAYNTSRGTDGGVVRWSSEFLDARLQAAVLRYLAVAHFGRGRGDYVDSEFPPHWKDVVARAAVLHAERATAIWRSAAIRAATHESPGPAPGLADELRGVLTALTIDVLDRLYPGALDDRFRGGLRASSSSTNTTT